MRHFFFFFFFVNGGEIFMDTPYLRGRVKVMPDSYWLKPHRVSFTVFLEKHSKTACNYFRVPPTPVCLPEGKLILPFLGAPSSLRQNRDTAVSPLVLPREECLAPGSPCLDANNSGSVPKEQHLPFIFLRKWSSCLTPLMETLSC